MISDECIMDTAGSVSQQEEEGLVSSSSAATATTAYSLRAKMVAELIGTTILVQVGTSANCIGLYVNGERGMWQIAVIWILAATIGILASGKISGGHLNPAVSLSFAVWRPSEFPSSNVLPYWAAQLAGAFVGSLINLAIFFKTIADYEANLGIERGSESSIQSAAALSDYWSLSGHVSSSFHAFFLEAFGTAFLVFTVFTLTNAANDVPKGAVPVLVGVAIGVMVNGLGPLTKYVLQFFVYWVLTDEWISRHCSVF